MSEQTRVETIDVQSDKAGKYLTFALGDEEYGLEILKVREIIQMMDITSVPKTPHQVKGVINLRGKVIPVVDLRLKMGMVEAERTDMTCVIVVNVGEVEVGIIVDKVSEVLDISKLLSSEDVATAQAEFDASQDQDQDQDQEQDQEQEQETEA